MGRGRGEGRKPLAGARNRRVWALASALHRQGILNRDFVPAVQAGDARALLRALVDPDIAEPGLQVEALYLVDSLWHLDRPGAIAAEQTLDIALTAASLEHDAMLGLLTHLAMQRLAPVYGVPLAQFSATVRQNLRDFGGRLVDSG